MLPKKFRLKNKKAFDATYKQRRVVSDSLLTVYAGRPKSDEKQQTKAGFVVSKKYHKRAVKRNRIKRLMREACRLLINNNLFNERYLSYIIMPKNSALSSDFAQIQASLTSLIKRI